MKQTVLAPTKPFIFYWSRKFTKGAIPEAREGAALACTNNRIYLFGGQGRMIYNEMRVLDIDSWSWVHLATKYTPHGRYGHSMVATGGKLIVYGGWGVINRYGRRGCFRKVHLLDLRDYKWQTYSGGRHSPAPRCHHAAEAIGQSMLVYGGTGANNKILKDFHVFDSRILEWSTP